ncbi:MAG: NUDIX domain-containing protein [Candidatus Diapherotrites archaeon]|nr:NUDIX domain-containing protein [Candidatus Diapherotrites archaeon]
MDNFGVAVKGFIVDDGKLLLLKREPKNVQMPGIWEISGGRLELGESPFDGLKREVLEETGLNVEIVMPLSVRHFTRSDKQTITMIIFLCKPLGNEVKLSKEHTEFEWIPLENAKEKITDFFFQEIDFYNKHDLQKLL